jgi:peptidoglycan/xylan/chitin deacetylase (PgdA/CDA1 family)
MSGLQGNHRTSHRQRGVLVPILLLAIAMIGLAWPAVAATSPLGTVRATYEVNIRACPRLDCQIIGSATLGDTMEITGDLANGFYPVTWYGREGYAYALYVSPGGEAPWFVEGDPACNQIALIFNIGVGYQPSQAIVDTLVASDTPATMFAMGWWAREHPDFLVQLDAAGFTIGTHGDQPLSLPAESNEAIVQDIGNSVFTIESILGREIDQYFTPYAADSDPRVRKVVSDLGLLPVGWKVAANDYGPDATAEDVYNRVMDSVYPGAVIEMHMDGPATESSTALALPRIIEELRAQGYELVSVPDLVIPCDGGSIAR